MTLDNNEPTKNGQHHRDSCNYSIEIAKQFLTIATAGVAFLVGMALKSQCSVTASWYWASGCLIASVMFGLIYLMSVVAHVNQSDNYDVYTSPLKIFSALQILSFLIALVLVGFITLRSVTHKSNPADLTRDINVQIQLKEKNIRLYIPKGRRAEISTKDDDVSIYYYPVEK
ncbi:hypothetical protein DSLASN_22810 [Desulfoluna limicola]|uniref:Transmembrane protein n=1 Tax=Desulfoluna limicola TaxID=2810562 RepID=A0ABM7PH90_9BACT|nr:hypothetical protein [Desulfoluna limicola]BCS96649.1 hypothetical protein DSLASN_22810 [Desulfoluna limicola]